MGRLLVALAVGASARIAAAEDAWCRRALRVVSARATYRRPLSEGSKGPRDGEIEVELTSSATVPISMVELGVFLGASLRDVQRTRGSALPTVRPRELEGGGLAFRAEVDTLLVPGGTRIARISKQGLPGEGDLSSVSVVVIECRGVDAVEGIATVVVRGADSQDGSSALALAALGLALGLATLVLVRLLR